MKNMDDTIGKAVFIIDVRDDNAKRQLSEWKSTLDKTMSEGEENVKSLAGGFNDLQASLAQLATAAVSFTTLSNGIDTAVESYNRFEASMNGVKAVALATGNDVGASLQAIKDITANGLISQEDAAASIKNLQLYGYSIKEATDLINIMTDAAVYNRQANYSVSEAVRVTTEGIRMENSTLSDASGITKNIAKMYEEYASQLGKSAKNLTDAEKQQAVYNGVLSEGGVFAGNAESYTSTLAGAQQQLGTSMEQVKQSIGAAFAQLAPYVSGLAQWVGQNKELIAGLAIFAGILIGGSGIVSALKLAVTAISAVKTALLTMSVAQKFAVAGFVGLAAAAAGMAVIAGINKQIEDLSDTTSTIPDVMGDSSSGIERVGESASRAAKQIAKLEQSLAKLDRDYRRSLKEIAVEHEENLATLTTQIEEANIDYKRAIDERMADFNVTLAKQERSHQETVDELMGQLSFLQRYNNDYNKQKIAQVQFALAKEQSLYQQETEALRAEIELQNAADKEKLDQKLASLQQELDDELDFMNKHRDTLNEVRGEILLDEIESLRERYEEQKKSYQDQIVEARISGEGASVAYQDGWDAAMGELYAKVKTDYSAEGEAAGTSYGKGFIQETWEWLQKGGIAADISKWLLGEERYNRWASGQGLFYGGWASGGYTGRGAPNEVAGIVHKGEYVVPADQVDQNTGLPKSKDAQNITINLSGVLATSAQAKRDLAKEILKAINQIEQSRVTV